MRFPRDIPPSNLHALQAWISTWATKQGVAQDRVQRWIAFELIAAAFEAARLDTGRPLFLLKGGFAMEVRLGLQARATKDIDLVMRADATFEQHRRGSGQTRFVPAMTDKFVVDAAELVSSRFAICGLEVDARQLNRADVRGPAQRAPAAIGKRRPTTCASPSCSNAWCTRSSSWR